MLAHPKNEFCAGGLIEITDSGSHQNKRRPRQLWQVESERNLALEPGFHGVPVGGNDVDRVGTGECRHMQVSQFAHQLPFPGAISIVSERQRDNCQQCSSNRSQSREPIEIAAWLPGYCESFLHASAETSVGQKALAGSSLNRALRLKQLEAIRGTRGAAAQVFTQGALVRGWEFAVHISIEFSSPKFARHALTPLQFLRRVAQSPPSARQA